MHVFTGRRPTPDLIAGLVPDAADRETFACAPGGLVEFLRGYLADSGQESDRFHTESFAHPEIVRPADDGSRYVVTFARTRRAIEVDGATTLLGCQPGGHSGADRLPERTVPSLCDNETQRPDGR